MALLETNCPLLMTSALSFDVRIIRNYRILFGEIERREMETDRTGRNSICQFTPKICQASTQLGSHNSTQVFHVGCRDLATRAITACYPGCVFSSVGQVADISILHVLISLARDFSPYFLVLFILFLCFFYGQTSDSSNMSSMLHFTPDSHCKID